MSQAKVDKYKNYKKNRRENIKKEKRRALIGKVIAWAVVVLIIAGVAAAIGVSCYNSYQAKLAAMPTYGSTSFLLSDYAGMQAADEAEDEMPDAEETETEAETETAKETESETETSEETSESAGETATEKE